MNDISKREFIALQILSGACAGDWKFDIPTGMKWETVAVVRSFEIADAFLDVSEDRIVIKKEDSKVVDMRIKPVKKSRIKNERE